MTASLQVQLSRSQRFWPHVAIWIPFALQLLVGFLLTFLMAVQFSAWFWLLVLLLAWSVKGFFVGFLGIGLVREERFELFFTDTALGIGPPGGRPFRWAAWEALKRVFSVRRIWVVSFTNGLVVELPQDQLPAEVLAFIQAKYELAQAARNDSPAAREVEIGDPKNHSPLVGLVFLTIVLGATLLSYFHDRNLIRNAQPIVATVVTVAPSTHPQFRNYSDVTFEYRDQSGNLQRGQKRVDPAGLRQGVAVGRPIHLFYNENFSGEPFRRDSWDDKWGLTLALGVGSGIVLGVFLFFLLVRKLNGFKLWG